MRIGNSALIGAREIAPNKHISCVRRRSSVNMHISVSMVVGGSPEAARSSTTLYHQNPHWGWWLEVNAPAWAEFHLE